MTFPREQIIAWAREAGINGPAPARQGFKMYANPQRLERFAALIEQEARADERGAAEERVADLFAEMETPYLPDIADAIRARGQA